MAEIIRNPGVHIPTYNITKGKKNHTHTNMLGEKLNQIRLTYSKKQFIHTDSWLHFTGYEQGFIDGKLLSVDLLEGITARVGVFIIREKHLLSVSHILLRESRGAVVIYSISLVEPGKVVGHDNEERLQEPSKSNINKKQGFIKKKKIKMKIN